MKALKIILFVLFLVTFGVFLGYKLPKKAINQPYTTADSLENVRIDSVKGVYQQEIDRISASKTVFIDRIKWLKGRDTVIYRGDDLICIEIIDRKDSIIADLDSAFTAADNEAQKYSEMLYLSEEQRRLEIKRNAALTFKMDSCIKSHADTLNAINERMNLNMWKRNGLWNKNKFRNFVKTGQK